MFAFFATLIILSIIITLVQAAFGIVLPGNKTGSQSGGSSCFNDDELDKYEDEIDDEILGVANHGRGLYKS